MQSAKNAQLERGEFDFVTEIDQQLMSEKYLSEYSYRETDCPGSKLFYFGMVGKKPNRAKIFGHPGLIKKLLGRHEVFVDTTVDAAPRPFSELMVILTRYHCTVSIHKLFNSLYKYL